MKQYILLLYTLIFGFPLIAMEIDVITKKNKQEFGIEHNKVKNIDSLYDLCCKVIAHHIDQVELIPDTNIPNFGSVDNHHIEKIFQYIPLAPERFDTFRGLLRWIKVNDESKDSPKLNLKFSKQQSKVAALMVDLLDKSQSDKELVDFIKEKNIVPNPNQRLAEALVGRKKISKNEIKIIERITKEINYSQYQPSNFRNVWNVLIKNKDNQTERRRCLDNLADDLRKAEAPFFDTMLLNSNYENYEQLKERYLALHKHLITTSSDDVKKSLEKSTITIPSTIDELTASFSEIGRIQQEITNASEEANWAFFEAKEKRIGYLLNNLSATLPEEETVKLGESNQ